MFLITAKHLFKDGTFDINELPIYLRFRKTLNKFVTEARYHKNVAIDIAVLKLSQVMPMLQYEIVSNSNQLAYGQDVYFMGYPTNYRSNPVYEDLPYLRRSCLSNIVIDENGTKKIILDGVNSNGFSGSPVFYRKAGTDTFAICSVVVCHTGHPSLLYNKDKLEIDKEYLTNLDPNNPIYFLQYEGIIETIDISHVIEVLESW